MPKLPYGDLGTWQACMWAYVPSSFVAYWDREGRGIDIYSPPSGGPGIQQTCKLACLCQHIVALWYSRYGNRHVKLVHGNSGTWQACKQVLGHCRFFKLICSGCHVCPWCTGSLQTVMSWLPFGDSDEQQVCKQERIPKQFQVTALE